MLSDSAPADFLSDTTAERYAQKMLDSCKSVVSANVKRRTFRRQITGYRVHYADYRGRVYVMTDKQVEDMA